MIYLGRNFFLFHFVPLFFFFFLRVNNGSSGGLSGFRARTEILVHQILFMRNIPTGIFTGSTRLPLPRFYTDGWGKQKKKKNPQNVFHRGTVGGPPALMPAVYSGFQQYSQYFRVGSHFVTLEYAL